MFSTRRFAANSIFFTAARIVTGAGNLLIWPYVILHVGYSLYGAWVLIGSTLTYVGLLDMSLGTAYIRLVANRSLPDYLDQVRRAAWLLTLYNLALSGVVAAVFVPLAPALGSHLFHLSSTQAGTWQGLVAVSCLILALNGLGTVLTLTLTALQYIAEVSLMTFVNWLFTVAVILIALHLGLSIWSLAAGYGGAALFTIVASRWLLRRYLPGFRWLLQGWRLDFIRQSFRFSLGLQVNRVVDLITVELDPILIGIIAGTGYVSYYSIGMTLANLPKDLTAGVVSSYLPEATARVSAGETERAAHFYWRTLQLLLLAGGYIAGGVVACAGSFVPVWFQRQVPYAALVAALMAVANAVPLSTAPGTNYLWAQGKSGWASVYSVVGLVINVGLTVPLALRFGFLGVVWGTAIGLTLGSLVFFLYFHRLFLAGMARSLWLGARVAACAAAGALAGLAVASSLPHLSSPARLSLERLLAAGAVYTLVFAAAALLLSLIDRRQALRVLR
ncbi:MAG: lipopolysaccharide biosynthesis protein, partial [Chloroflexi bacterium]|nr:lipopolysaccharide biosynthesis protein [Chloroflexota bacterium]